LAACAAVLVCGSMAQAQATRTWVSGVGDDANPCSRTAPCKTFAGAISKTAAGGEINALDPGGYGAVTITKAITIDGGGTLASILAAGTNGIIISAGVNDKVIIRNVSINGAGTGLNGIRFLAGNQLSVENVTIQGFTTNGIDVSKTASGVVFVKDTNITKCATGVRLTTTGGFITATLDNARLEAMTTGINVGALSFASISDSVISSNGTGVNASASGAVANVENSMLSFNGTAINASASGATVRLSGNGLYNNGTGITFAAGGVVASNGSNRVSGNGASTAPNGTVTNQ
jgi:hypothetical protein